MKFALYISPLRNKRRRWKMEEAKIKILKMLEEGKITAEEAVKLLEALGEKETASKTTYETTARGRRKSLFGVGELVDGLMEMVREVLAASLSSIPAAIAAGFRGGIEEIEEEIPIEDTQKLIFDLKAGDFDIIARNDSNSVKIEGEGVIHHEFDEQNKTLRLEVSVGDANMIIPKGIPIEVNLSAGDLDIVNAPTKAKIKVSGGDADIKFGQGVENVEIRVSGGDVDVYVPKDADFTLNATVKWGEFTLPKGVNSQRKGPFSKTAVFGSGQKGKMDVEVSYGDFGLVFIEDGQ